MRLVDIRRIVVLLYLGHALDIGLLVCIQHRFAEFLGRIARVIPTLRAKILLQVAVFEDTAASIPLKRASTVDLKLLLLSAIFFIPPV